MECVNRRMAEGLQNCVVLCWELQRLGHQGGCSLVKSNVSLRFRRSQVQATVRFETTPGIRPRWTGGPWPMWERMGDGARSECS